MTRYRSMRVLTPPQVARFWSNVVRLQPTQCWEWHGYTQTKGYGLYSGLLSHRLAYWLHHGVDPGPLKVCHTCDNPPCCNPAHLFLGTSQHNSDDMVAKGRAQHHKGEKASRAKLTEQDVRRMRRCSAPYTKLARSHGLSVSAVRAAAKGVNWSHIDEPARARVHLTPESVRAIRSSDLTGRQLAVQYNVSEGTVSMIRNGRTWKHV